MSYSDLIKEWNSLRKQEAEIKARKRELRQKIAETTASTNYLERPYLNEKPLARAREIIDQFNKGITYQEIADQYGVTRQYVQQVIKKMGFSRGRLKAMNPECKVDECQNKATSLGYCPMHYQRVKRNGTPTRVSRKKSKPHCLVGGCENFSKVNGLCNKHATNFHLNKSAGNIHDLNDFLKVQKAKRMMGKTYGVKFEGIRAFMEANKEHFELDLYKEDAHGSDDHRSNPI